MTQDWFDSVAPHGLCYRPSLQATYDLTRSALRMGIPGDLVECGVFAGANSAMMARAGVGKRSMRLLVQDRFTSRGCGNPK